MGSHSVTHHLAELTFPPLPQPIKAATRFSDPRGMQGWVDLAGLVTYRGGVPTRRRVTHPSTNRAQCRVTSCDKRRYYYSCKCVLLNLLTYYAELPTKDRSTRYLDQSLVWLIQRAQEKEDRTSTKLEMSLCSSWLLPTGGAACWSMASTCNC